MKKFLLFSLIILAFAFSACLPHGGEPSVTDAPTEPPEEHDDRFADTDLDLIDMGDHYIWTARSYGRYYYYHDKTTGEFGVLCSKPECMHDANGIDRDCGGFVECSIPSVTYYEGKLYFFDTHKEAGEAEKLALMRMEPDGTRREFVKYIDVPEACTPVCFGIYRGRLFVYAREQSVVGAEPNIAVDIFVSDLKSGEFTNIYRNQYGSYIPFVYLRYRGGYMYFFCGLRANANSGLSCEIHR